MISDLFVVDNVVCKDENTGYEKQVRFLSMEGYIADTQIAQAVMLFDKETDCSMFELDTKWHVLHKRGVHNTIFISEDLSTIFLKKSNKELIKLY